jgi:hypothetical protein
MKQIGPCLHQQLFSFNILKVLATYAVGLPVYLDASVTSLLLAGDSLLMSKHFR